MSEPTEPAASRQIACYIDAGDSESKTVKGTKNTGQANACQAGVWLPPVPLELEYSTLPPICVAGDEASAAPPPAPREVVDAATTARAANDARLATDRFNLLNRRLIELEAAKQKIQGVLDYNPSLEIPFVMRIGELQRQTDSAAAEARTARSIADYDASHGLDSQATSLP